ncbi:class I SAM-dependent methyltransferase [Pinirhizobacter sp.]|uniref:class I SAM-dependent methyltransferase n=1 Tax=Pinirhizobacter sp. TaxID=2950432 RepID=UPI0039C96289
MRCLPPLRLKLDYYGRHLRGVGRRLLDVGCGNGEFVARARDMGWDSHGVDPDPAAVAAGRSRGLQITHGTLADVSVPNDADAWDVITLSHSIEHVTQPKVVLSQVLNMLRPGGYVWMAWPNPQSMGRFYCGRYWESFDPPRHLCLYSRRSMQLLLSEAGYESIRFHRRGSHAGRIYRVSAEASQRAGSGSWRFLAPIRILLTLIADLIATIDPRWSEELVVTAFKPKA